MFDSNKWFKDKEETEAKIQECWDLIANCEHCQALYKRIEALIKEKERLLKWTQN